MTITVLAVIFLVLLVVLALVGQKLLTQKTDSLQETTRGECFICRNDFDKSELVEREIGDFKIAYFCRRCIEKLYADLTRRTQEKTLSHHNQA